MQIFTCHLLNDFSGSPKVLMQLINGWITAGIKVTIVTSNKTEGFLSNIKGAKYCYIWYKWAKNPWVRLLNFCVSQFIFFTKIIFKAKKNDIVYINTVLPFGAAIAGKIKGCQVIYHIHETSIKPIMLKKWLFFVVKKNAKKIIYVSQYLQNQEFINNKLSYVLPNSIETNFINIALAHEKKTQYKNVLMICSLKLYKGVHEFLNLAKNNPHFEFKLVLNSKKEEIDLFFKETVIPKNLETYPTQTNTHPFYKWADILLNLSRPNEWIETFGLTIIEAMAYHIPCIVPPIGGPSEIILDRRNGFLVDCRNDTVLSEKLNLILSDRVLYKSMQEETKQLIKQYKEETFINQSIKIINAN